MIICGAGWGGGSVLGRVYALVTLFRSEGLGCRRDSQTRPLRRKPVCYSRGDKGPDIRMRGIVKSLLFP